MAKLNQDVFTLTLGSRQIPPRALILSKKKKRVKFKQYCHRLKENGDLLLSMLLMTDGIPTVAELMDSPLAKHKQGYHGNIASRIQHRGRRIVNIMHTKYTYAQSHPVT